MTRFLEHNTEFDLILFDKLASSAEFTSLKFVFVTSAPPKKSEKYSPLETDSSLYMMYSMYSVLFMSDTNLRIFLVILQ